MHLKFLFTYTFLFCLLAFTANLPAAQSQSEDGMTIIEQDYEQALREAARQDKIIFVDFYTTWCGPCKRLDKVVFYNDSIAKIMGQDVVLLKYDAERDTTHHLSKKFHVSSYPTGLLLTPEGMAVERQSGFRGADAAGLQQSVLDFIRSGLDKRKQGQFLSGYAQVIDPTVYPDFYVDFVNRTDTKVEADEVNAYLNSVDDVLSESFASVLFYFCTDADERFGTVVQENRKEFTARYGEANVDRFLSGLIVGAFGRAIDAADTAAFVRAEALAEDYYGAEEARKFASSFHLDMLRATGNWQAWVAGYQAMKERGEMDNGYLNHVSWQVFKECDDPTVLATALEWMRQVVDEEPDEFDYLDTYALLLHKKEGKVGAKDAILAAIEVGKKVGRKTGKLKKLLD